MIKNGASFSVENVVIDDLRSFKEGFNSDGALYARTSLAGLELLQKVEDSGVKKLWLDHDLGLQNGEADTIMVIVDWLAEKSFNGELYPVEEIIIHTSNPVGRKQMKATLERWGYNVSVLFDASEVFIVEEESVTDD